jgi:integrase
MGSVYRRNKGKPNESRIWYYSIKVQGRWREFAGFTDKGATQVRMRDHQRRVERGEVGLVDPHEAGKRESLTKLVAAYIGRPDAAQQSPRHLVGERERLMLAFAEMQVSTFHDIVGPNGNDAIPRVEAFINRLRLGEVRAGRPTHAGGKPKPRPPASVATVRGYVVTLRAFGRYLVERGTWPRNPFEALKPVKIQKSDRKRENRALTPEEIDLLVQAAEVRPVQEWRRTHPNASDEHLEKLRVGGVHRGRIYLTLAYTGLRVGELAQLTWAELNLVEGQEIAEIAARKQKGRDDDVVVLHPLLAEMLRRHRQECSKASTRAGRGPVRNADRVFRVSSSLLRWLKLDAEWAGVGLFDARGRATTIHGIRSGFATTLRRNATDPALRMRLMRHKTADLTLRCARPLAPRALQYHLQDAPGRSGPMLAARGRSTPQQPRPPNRRTSRELGVPGRPWPLLAAPGRSPTTNPN